MPPITALHPLAAGERVQAMDVLRAVALLGIVLMNIEGFAGPVMAAVTGVDPALSGLDRAVDTAIYVLVQGKFYLLFSLLFGMGFATMRARAEAAGRAFGPMYLRRTLALLVIGVAHLLLVWSGDILTVYALLALPLLLVFRSVPTAQLPYWAAGLYALNVTAVLGLHAIGTLARLEPTMAAAMDLALREEGAAIRALVAAERAAYGGGDYAAAVAQRALDALTMVPATLMLSGQILGMFVLGAWFSGSGAIARPRDFGRLYARLRWGALPAGLALMLVSFALVPTIAYDRLDLTTGIALALSMFGGLGMCLGYVAWTLRGLDCPIAPALRWLAPAGRMALTHYLAQSVVCTLVFYGYGLGWFEQVPRAWQAVLAVALFALQAAFSHVWLARYRFGPAEWLWRAVTYLQWPPLRRGPGRPPLPPA